MGGSNSAKSFLINQYKSETLVKKTYLSDLRGITIAIDASGMIRRAMIHSGNKKWWLQFINLMHKFSNHGIKPVIIIDGKPISEKQDSIDDRKKQQDKIKKKLNDTMENCRLDNDNDNNENILQISKYLKQIISIKSIDIEICKQICNLLGILCIHVKSQEADDIFHYLINNGIVDSVYSEDNDMFRRGCNLVHFGLDYKLDTLYEFKYDECLYKMNVTPEQFNNAYDASGTDFNDNLEYCKFKENIELMKEYGSIENVIANLNKINLGKTSRIIKVPKRFDFIKTREIFNREISQIVISQIHDFVYNFKFISSKVKLNYIQYSQKLFSEIEIVCDFDIKECYKYKKQVKEYYKNVYDVYI